MKNLLKTLLSRGITAAGAISFSIFVIHHISIEESGAIFFWITNVYVLSYIIRLGLDTYLLKTISINEDEQTPEKKRFVFLLGVFASLVIAQIASYHVVLLVSSLSFFALSAINSSVLRASGKHFLSGILEPSSISAIAALLLLISTFFVQHIDIAVVSGAFLVSSVAVFIVGEASVQKKHRIATNIKERLASLDKKSIPFLISPLVIFSTQWIPMYFLSASAIEQVSIYNIAIRIGSIFGFIAISIDNLVAPQFSVLNKAKQHKEANQLIRKIRLYSSIFCIISMGTYLVFGQLLIKEIAGEEYLRSFTPSLIIMLGYCFMLVSGPFQYYLLMSGNERNVNRANFLALVVVSLGCALLYFFGLLDETSAALALLIGRMASTVMIWFQGSNQIHESTLRDGKR